MQFTNISNAGNLEDYIPILTAAIVIDMLVSTISCVYLNTQNLKRWYKTYNLGAVLTDVLILVIAVQITRYILLVVCQ